MLSGGGDGDGAGWRGEDGKRRWIQECLKGDASRTLYSSACVVKLSHLPDSVNIRRRVFHSIR